MDTPRSLNGATVVAFDCYGTLIDFADNKFVAAMADIAQRHGLPVDGQTLWSGFLEASRELWGEGEKRPFLPYREKWAIMFETACANLGFRGDGNDASGYLHRRLSEAKAYPETQSVISALRSKYRVALLSNADDDHLTECLEINGLADQFEAIVSSEGVGATKPNSIIFQRLVERLETSPANVIYVGDSPIADVKGALMAGMAAVWLNRHGAVLPEGIPLPDAEVKTLTDLAGLLSCAAPAVPSQNEVAKESAGQ